MITALIIALVLVIGIRYYLYRIASLVEQPSSELDIAKSLYPGKENNMKKIETPDIIFDLDNEFETKELSNNTAFKLHDIVKITDADDTNFAKNECGYVIGFDESDGSYLVANEFNKEWLFADQMKKVRK